MRGVWNRWVFISQGVINERHFTVLEGLREGVGSKVFGAWPIWLKIWISCRLAAAQWASYYKQWLNSELYYKLYLRFQHFQSGQICKFGEMCVFDELKLIYLKWRFGTRKKIWDCQTVWSKIIFKGNWILQGLNEMLHSSAFGNFDFCGIK